MRVKKIIKRVLLAIPLLLIAAIVSAPPLIRRYCAAPPPPLPADTSITKLKPETRDGRTWLGRSWYARREGLPIVCLRGSPFEIGYASGALLTGQIHHLEEEFLALIRGYVPSEWTLNALKYYIAWRNRRLSDFVPQDIRLEIFASTLACPDIRPELGDYYTRTLNYHSAHDVSYMLIDNPLIAAPGCTGFGAWGPATGGHVIGGRNFDWEACDAFGRERLLILCEPDDGIPFASLAWAGMAGVVSGMNRAGISVTVNGAPSSLPRETATPAAIVARQIMQRASNLAEAEKILRDAKVFVSTLWLIGSRADGHFIVVEKTPDATHVRDTTADAIICANHFETATLKDSPENTAYMAGSTSVSRDARLTELLRETRGRITPAIAAAILRDRRLPGGTFPGNGHRGTLNALIATHSTIMDLTDGIFWVATPPHQLGSFVAIDMNDFDRQRPDLAIPPDPMLNDSDYDNATFAKANLDLARKALKEKSRAATNALDFIESAEALNPGYYQNSMLRAEALRAAGRPAEAAAAAQQALDRHPAFLDETQRLRAMQQGN